jgi:RNA polymerase sigma-70 factor, ECF subfamily
MDDAERESQALARLRSGDKSAVRTLYDLHASRLFRSVIMPMLKDRGAAEDALRDTFLSALERIGTFSGDSAFSWLAMIARNKAIDALRSRGVRQRLTDAATFEEPPPVANPEELVSMVEAREKARARIESVLAQLDARYARALRLRLIEERERAECAEKMGISIGNFDVVLFRACKAFRTRYVQQFGEEP